MVKLLSNFKEIAGASQVIIENAKDVRSLLNELVEKFGHEFESRLFEEGSRLRSSVVILVNGHSIRLGQGLDTPLSAGDILTADSVAIFETVGGG